MTRLLSRAALARMAGVHRSSVTRAAERGGPLHGALRGDRVDADHPDAARWLASRSSAQPTAARADEIAADLGSNADLPLDEIADLTLKQITDRFGGVEGFREFVDARRSLAYARRAENAERVDKLDLIPRGVLQRHFDRLEIATKIIRANVPPNMATAMLHLVPPEVAREIHREEHGFRNLCRVAGELMANEINASLKPLLDALVDDYEATMKECRDEI